MLDVMCQVGWKQNECKFDHIVVEIYLKLSLYFIDYCLKLNNKQKWHNI